MCMYVCMYVCIYIYIRTQKYTYDAYASTNVPGNTPRPFSPPPGPV